MKTLSLIIILFSLKSFACSLNNEIVSLSGPITATLEGLEILNDPNLKAISEFYKPRIKYRGVSLAGGLFLSKKTLKKYQKAHFFFDQSIELSNSFQKAKVKNAIEVKTVGQNSFETQEQLLVLLKPYLSNCEKQIEKFQSFIKELKEIILKKKRVERLANSKVIFYLGSCQDGRRPPLIIANDGFIKTIKDFKLFKTYSSSLAYANWSQKELKKFDTSDALEVCLVDKAVGGLKSKRIGKLLEVYSENVLVPGIWQIIFLSKFLPRFADGTLETNSQL